MRRIMALLLSAAAALSLCACGENKTAENAPAETEPPEQSTPDTLQDRDVPADLDVIRRYHETVNAGDLDGYIELFCAEIREEMRAFVEMNGAEDFFSSESRVLRSVAALRDSFIEENAWLFDDVFAGFEKFCVYYVVEDLSFPEESEVKRNGTQSNLYVIVLEDGVRKLYRVSAVDELDGVYLDFLE